jgi:hypothetical protein
VRAELLAILSELSRRVSISAYILALAARRRWRDKANGTRLVSMVIQRRPHCSATYAVVPLPHVGSKTKSPGSVVIRIQRCRSFVGV